MGMHLFGGRRARSKGFRLLLIPGIALCALIGTTVAAAPAFGLGSPVLLTITVSPTATNVPAGETQEFTATGHYSNLTTANITSQVTWSSSLTSDATVSSVGVVTAVATGASTITATDPSDSLIFGTSVVTVIPAVLLGVSVAPGLTQIPEGETSSFTATGLYSDGSSQNFTKGVTWSTSDSTVAGVSNLTGSEGVVSAVGTGLATVTATDPSDSAIFGTSAVTVTSAVLLSISVSPTAVNVPAGETQQFTATGLYSNATTQNLTDTVTWSSSVTADATVSNAAGSEGVVTAVANGASTITATDPANGLIFGTGIVTIIPAVLLSIKVNPAVTNIPVGDALQFGAVGTYSDGSTENLTDTVTWSSSITADASVSATGEVTALAEGASTISATDGATVGVSVVTVLPAELLTITVTPPISNVAVGETEDLTATGTYTDGSQQNITDEVTWSSSEASDASVSDTGVVSGNAIGAATITGTDPADSAIFGVGAVTVLPAVLISVAVTPPLSNVPAGNTEQLTATGTYSDGSTQNITDDVTWSSSVTSDATVSTDGLVTGVSTGGTTITATDASLPAIFGAAVVTVLPAVLVTIAVTPLASNVPAGTTEQMKATGIYSDGSTQNLTDSVTWASTETDFATVSNTVGSQGVVTGVSDGASTISATDESSGTSGQAVVTVLPAVLVGITVSPLETSIAQYGTQQFKATGIYSDGSTSDVTDQVTWSSTNDGDAVISNAAGSVGLATGVSPGSVTITAVDQSTTSIFGVAGLEVTGPAITISPTSGPQKTKIVLTGQGFDPGASINVLYVTNNPAHRKYRMCLAIASPTGTISCHWRVRSTESGPNGIHQIRAKVLHTKVVLATAEFTLIPAT